MIRREKKLDEETELQVDQIERDLKDRSSRVLRKFWDLKVGEVLDYERELKSPGKKGFSLVKVLKGVQQRKN